MVVLEILDHVKMLQSLGYGVMIFRARELYTMSAFVNRYTKSRIHFAIGLTVLVRVFEDRYKDLPGTLLEGIARLFTQNVRLIVYPRARCEVRMFLSRLIARTWLHEPTCFWILRRGNFLPRRYRAETVCSRPKRIEQPSRKKLPRNSLKNWLQSLSKRSVRF